MRAAEAAGLGKSPGAPANPYAANLLEHIQKRKWFSFGFNGQLANYPELRREILADGANHLARDNDTEVILHAIGRELAGNADPSPMELLAAISRRFQAMISVSLSDIAAHETRRRRENQTGVGRFFREFPASACLFLRS